MAAPAYVNHGTGVTTGTSVTVTKPSGTLDGHLMLVHIQHSTGNLGADGTAPSGWTLIGTRQENASSSHWYYWKIASSEGASWGWTNYASATLQYGIIVVSGADQTTPLNVTHLLQNTNIAGTTVDLSVVTTVADCLLVGFAGQDQTVSTNVWSQGSMTERYDENQTADLTHCGYTETATTATTYNRTITASVAQRISGALIGVAPASNVNVTPSPVAAVASVPAATIPAGAVVTPASVNATAAVPAPTVSTGGNATATPATVAPATAVPMPSISTGSTVTTPTTVAATASVPAATMHAGSIVTPMVVSAVASIPSPAVSAGGSATVSPATIAAVATIPAPTLTTSTNLAAATVNAVSAVPAASVRTGSTVSAVPVAASATIPAPAIQAGTTVVPAAVNAVTLAPVPTVRLGVLLTPAAVASAASVPAPTMHTSVFVPAFTVAAVATIPAPAVITLAPYTPLTDPVAAIRLNLASSTISANPASSTARANPAEAEI